jgi:hypothetical protein
MDHVSTRHRARLTVCTLWTPEDRHSQNPTETIDRKSRLLMDGLATRRNLTLSEKLEGRDQRSKLKALGRIYPKYGSGSLSLISVSMRVARIEEKRIALFQRINFTGNRELDLSPQDVSDFFPFVLDHSIS